MAISGVIVFGVIYAAGAVLFPLLYSVYCGLFEEDEYEKTLDGYDAPPVFMASALWPLTIIVFLMTDNKAYQALTNKIRSGINKPKELPPDLSNIDESIIEQGYRKQPRCKYCKRKFNT